MARTFEAQSLISIPRLNGAGAYALGVAIVTAAEKKSLSQPIAAALKKLSAAIETLGKALGTRTAPAGNGAETRAADSAEDNAWAALSEFLSAWSRLPDSHLQAKKAREVQAALFPDGLRFTTLGYKQEWAEADARLQRIRRGGLDAAITDLGGAAFVENLVSAHEAYGKVLGITSQKAPAPTAADVREPLDNFTRATRSYALQVAAMADEDAASQQLADELLEPLTSWQSKQSAPTPEPAPAPAPAAVKG